MKKMTPRAIGDTHLHDVKLALISYCNEKTIPDCSTLSGATAQYVIKKYPNLTFVRSKMDMENSDHHHDLTITLSTGDTVNINLYKIKGNANIQPKNLGAKSFLKKYFQSKPLQEEFNSQFENAYREYLTCCAKSVSDNNFETEDTKTIRAFVHKQYDSFTSPIEPFRQALLYGMREQCFLLLSKEYNAKSASFKNAFNELFMMNSINIISRYKGNNEVLRVEEFNAQFDEIDRSSVSKVGLYSVGITAGKHTSDIPQHF